MHHLVASGARRALPFVLVAAAACGSPARSSTPPAPVPTPPTPPASDGNTVAGTERIGWDQGLLAGSSQDEYTFSWFVDDLRAGAAAATCAAQSATLMSCSAPLPKLTPGTHRLRVTAVRTLASGRFESPQSDALTVVQLGSSFPALTPGVTAAAPEVTGARIPAGAREDRDRPATERITVVARGLDPVSDIAIAGDLVIVAERQGTIRLVRDGSMLPGPALALAGMAANAPGLGLLAVAAHPDFANNHLIYWISTADTPAGPVYRIARGREAGGRIGETAVLLDGVEAAAAGWAALRFGPDGRLYAAFGAASDAVRSGSYAGHVLRLDEDGRTPRDNAAATPVLAETGGTPLALVWNDAGELGIVRALPDGRRDLRTSLAQTGGTQPWRANEQPAGAAYYRADLLPDLAGRLLVGMMDGGIGLADAPGATGGYTRRIAAAYGAARALAISASGEIYLGTANGDLSSGVESARRQDVLLCVKGARR
jgi:glucose/arabinose dehydrogenase